MIKLIELAQKYRCRVMVDDAHGLELLGKRGEELLNISGLQVK